MGPGVALDLRTVSQEGIRWGFDGPARRKGALLLVRQVQPKLLVGCPECTAFSVLQPINPRRKGAEEYER